MVAELPVIGDLKSHAIEYARTGFEIFPVHGPTKQPMAAHVPGAPSQYGATTDTDRIAAWWDRWPDALIGHRLPQGQIILDIDPRHGGHDTWRLLRAEFDIEYPQTRLHVSGRNDGGGHMWFLRPADKLTISKLDDWAREHGTGHAVIDKDGNDTGHWVCGLDLLHRNHRYTILPPSPHPETGQPYRWHQWTEVGPAHPAVAELLTDDSPPPPPYVPKEYDGESIADWYSAKHGVGEHLHKHGWHLRSTGSGDADGARWQHPTATAPISATVRHGCLFVYSPNTPFDVTAPGDPHGYTAFRVYAVLEHGGDLAAAAKAARELKDGPSERRPERNPFEADWEALDQQTTPSAAADTPTDAVDDEPKPTTWAPVDLTAALEGLDVDPPAWWRRSDGTPLVYAGRTHWFQGPSESLKSMAAQMLVTEALEAGTKVLYLDFEDDDRGVVARLLSMGVTPDRIRALLTYVRPDEPLQARDGKWTPGGLDYLRLLQIDPQVVILDGVTEAMTTEGMDLLDNGDTARWMRLLPKRLADTGAAVVVIDHTTKNAETAGRHAIGAQHKLAGVTGATYKFEVLRPLARAVFEPVTGQVKVTVTKDRPGWVRGRCPEGQVGVFEVTSHPDGGLSTAVMAPGAESQAVDMQLVGEVLAHLQTYEGATGRHIEDALNVKGARVRGAIKAAIGRGWIEVHKVGASHQHTITSAGREIMK